MLFEDRVDGGKKLAEVLRGRRFAPPVMVIALPRGGVPVAREVARELELPMDLLIVRKIGLPAQPEFGIGAMAEGAGAPGGGAGGADGGADAGVSAGAGRGGTGARDPTVWLDERTLARIPVDPEELAETIENEKLELQRRVELYRRGRPMRSVRGATVLLIDDGLATGVSMRVAARALRARGAARVVAAVPVAAADSSARLAGDVDEVIAVAAPRAFGSVGRFYRLFPQLTDAEVLDI